MYVHMYNAEYVQTAEMRHGKIRTWVGVFHRALPHLPESRAMCDVRVEGGERVIREREGFQLRETFEHAQVIDAGFLVVVDLVAARGGAWISCQRVRLCAHLHVCTRSLVLASCD